MAKLSSPIKAWALYDFGNSAYSTTVMAGFFPLFYKQYWSAGADAVVTTQRLGDLTALTSLLVAFMTPTLGTLADRTRFKKGFLLIFAALGWVGCASLGFLGEGAWVYASLAFALATVGFNASSTFYDSLLPSVADNSNIHTASSLGFALGYLGGGLLFLVNVLAFLYPSAFGLAGPVDAVKWSFISVALWWAVFSIPLMKKVPEPQLVLKSGAEAELGLTSGGVAVSEARGSLAKDVWLSILQLKSTLKEVFANKPLFYCLLAFWLYIDGVYTVMTMAVDFGLSIGLESKDLIGALLLVQFIGFPSALLWGRWGQNRGPQKPILACIAGYSVITILASQMTQGWQFYALAVGLGIFQGGIQALSRSLLGQLIPSEKSGEYFGFINLVGRFAAISGPFLVARITGLTGDHRIGLLSLLILFALGAFFLITGVVSSGASSRPSPST